MGKVTYRLIGEDQPLTWSVPQEGVMAIKKDKGLKYINYYPGQDSIFTEDITNKDIKPSKVPEFAYKPLVKATELQVEDNNKALINYLTAHPWNGVKWKIHSKEIEAETKLSQFDKVDKALELIRESDELKVKANALAVFGLHAFNKTQVECAAMLKEKAINKPDVIINAFKSPDWEARLLASLAFCQGIIKNNMTSTAVVWNDGKEGVIVHVATGENGIDKLAEFLSTKTDESTSVMQEFDNRMKKVKAAAVTPVDAQAEIEKLRKENEALKKQGAPAGNETEKVDYSEKSLEELQSLYQQKKNFPVPSRFKNDRDWIIEKIAEA